MDCTDLHTTIKEPDEMPGGHLCTVFQRQVVGILGEPLELYRCEKFFSRSAWPGPRRLGLVASLLLSEGTG